MPLSTFLTRAWCWLPKWKSHAQNCFSLPPPTLSCVVLPISIGLHPQAEISLCGWMRVCTWRMPCQSWESCKQLPDRGFLSLGGCECLVLSGPDCLAVGVVFCLLVLPAPAQGAPGGSAWVFGCVSVPCACGFVLHQACSPEPLCLHGLAFTSRLP